MTRRLLPLDNPVKHYAWGSPTAIPAILGDDNPGGEPWAELWMGAHPAAPSAALTEAGPVPLSELFTDGELPLLLKLLAAAQPLSIQCHPDREQARAGFAREEAAGIPRDAPHRSYRDRHHKPELLVAESRFAALAGFRAPDAIAANLDGLGVEELSPEARALRKTGDLRAFFAQLMRLDRVRRERALAEAEAAARGARSPEAARVAELLARHPGDIGALAPLYLNLLELSPGEGLFLPARQLHAYLEGVGIEVMASSDNVLRGGLTSKHVDVHELLAVLDFEPMEPRVLRPERRGGAQVYPAPAEEFELWRVDVEGDGLRELDLGGSVAIAFCIEGSAELADGASGEVLALARGRAALVGEGAGLLRVTGAARLFIARVPAGSSASSGRTPPSAA